MNALAQETATRRFRIADLEVCLRADGLPDPLPPTADYHRYPPRGADPGLLLDIDCADGYRSEHPCRSRFPAFDAWAPGPAQLHLARSDAEGRFEIESSNAGGVGVRGFFRAAASPHTIEAVIRVGASLALPRRGALILHSSAVADARGVHLFLGPSGAGKSTIAEVLSRAGLATKFSDELLIVSRQGEGFVAEVTPFVGSAGLPHGERRPVASLNFLRQSAHNRGMPMSPGQIVPELLRNVLIYTRDAATAGRVLEIAAGLATSIPCSELHFRPEASIAEVLGIT